MSEIGHWLGGGSSPMPGKKTERLWHWSRRSPHAQKPSQGQNLRPISLQSDVCGYNIGKASQDFERTHSEKRGIQETSPTIRSTERDQVGDRWRASGLCASQARGAPTSRVSTAGRRQERSVSAAATQAKLNEDRRANSSIALSLRARCIQKQHCIITEASSGACAKMSTLL